MDLPVSTVERGCRGLFLRLPSVDTAPLLKHVIPLLPAETCKTHQLPKAQSDFTVVFEGKVMQNMGFLALQVKKSEEAPGRRRVVLGTRPCACCYS